MNLSLLDWCIIIVFFVFITAVATYTRRYTRSVADFLSASRCAGRYLLTVSEGMAGFGAISLIAGYQVGLQNGLTWMWWSNINIPVSMILAITGFVIYRFRQTRALTLAEFAERRYSKKFRIFMGFIIFISGVLNFGIFPSVGSKFFIYFCGFGEQFHIGSLSVPTYPVVMAVLLIISLYFTYIGGQIGVMLTDFIQASFCYIITIGISIFIFVSLGGWQPLEDVLLNNPDNVHLIHPFRGSDILDFNVWFYLMIAVLGVYTTRSWQGSQGYNSAALTPHEAKMGGIIGTLRGYVLILLGIMPLLATIVILQHHDFSSIATRANAIFVGIGDEQIRNQMQVPVVMSFLLSKGLRGCFAVVFLAAFISTHDTYLHSWGSIFIQDVVMPFRKKPFAKEQHMHLLRVSIFGVAVFAFIFSLVWKQTEAILLWLQITGSIYMGGAGSVIIGGLYSRRGSTLAAYCSMTTGLVLAMLGIVMQQLDSEFFLNGIEISFYVAIAACLVYVVVSLLGPKKVYDLDKLLHRGKYAVAEDTVTGDSEADAKAKGLWKRFWSKLGLSDEFNRRDKFIYFFAFGFPVFWFLVFLAGTVYHFIFDTSAASWMAYWKLILMIMFVFSVIVNIWLNIDGIMDIKKMFSRLRTLKRDEHDDGWVNSEDNSPATNS